MMYIRLDNRHRLIFNDKMHSWFLYKVIRTGPYNKEKIEKLNEKKKKVVVLQDKKGNKAIGVWKYIGSYSPTNTGNAITTWLYSLLGDKYKGEELTTNKVVKILDTIKKAITRMVLLSNVLRLKVEIVDATPDMLAKAKKAEEEMKLSQDNEINPRFKSLGLITDTVFTTCVSDKTDGVVGYNLDVDSKGNVTIEKSNKLKVVTPEMFGFDKFGNEIVIVDERTTEAKRAFGGGKKKSTGSLLEVIDVPVLEMPKKRKKHSKKKNKKDVKPKKESLLI